MLATRRDLAMPDLLGTQMSYDAAGTYESLAEVFGENPMVNEAIHAAQNPDQYLASISAPTLATAYQGLVNHQIVQLIQTLETMSGWHTKIASLERTEKQGIAFHAEVHPNYVLDRVPEGVVPRTTSHRVEERVIWGRRFGLTAEAHHSFYKTESGLRLMKARQDTILSAAIQTSKMLVEEAIINDKLWFREFQRRNKIVFPNLAKAVEDEVEYFAVLNKDKLGMNKLIAYVDRISQTSSGVTGLFDTFVLGPGVSEFLILSNGYETQAYQRGDAAVQENLSLGAKPAFRFAGRQIYENPAWRAQNWSGEDYNLFQREATIGEYVMIDGSKYGRDDIKNRHSAEEYHSVKFIDLNIDDFATLSIKDAIDKSGRFGEDGFLSKTHQELIQQLPTVAREAQISISDGDVDPFIARASANGYTQSPVVDGSQLNPADYKPIDMWGEMSTKHWSVQQNIDHGTQASHVIQSMDKTIDFSILKKFTPFNDKLANVVDGGSLTDEEKSALVGYIYMVTLLNPPASLILSANNYGGLQLPKIQSFNGKLVWYIDEASGGQASYSYDTTTRKIIRHDLKSPTVTPATFDKRLAYPWGFVGVNHLRTLASLKGGVAGYQEYNQDVFAEAAVLLDHIDRYVRILKTIYPNNAFFHSNTAPDYVRSGTGDLDVDARNSVVTNLFDERRNPIYVRFQAGMLDAELTPVRDTQDRLSKIEKLLNAISSWAAAKVIPGDFHLRVLEDVVVRAKTSTLELFAKKAVDASTSLRIIQEHWNEVPELGKSYFSLLNQADQAEATKSVAGTLDLFFKNEIVPLIASKNRQGAANLLLFVLNSIDTDFQGISPTPLTRQQIDANRDYSVSKTQSGSGSGKKRLRDQTTTLQSITPFVGGEFVNSRLVLSPSFFEVFGSAPVSGGADFTDVIQEMIRAGDPERPGIPLGDQILGKTGGNLTIGVRNDRYFEYARAPANNNNSQQEVSSNSFSSYSGATYGGRYEDRDASSYVSKKARRDFAYAVNNIPSGLDPRKLSYIARENFTTPGGIGLTSGGAPRFFLNLRTQQLAEQEFEVRVPALMQLYSFATRQSLFTWINKNLSIPMSNFLLLRPFCRIATEGLVAFNGNSSNPPARIIHGHENCTNQFDNRVEKWLLNYNVWLGAGIVDSTRVMFIPDVRAVGYVGGLDSSIYTDPEEFNPTDMDYQKSGFVVAVSPQFTREIAQREANPLCIFGRTSSKNAAASFEIPQQQTQQYPGALFTLFRWGFLKINSLEVGEFGESFDEMRKSNYKPGICKMGHHRSYDITTRSLTQEHRGTGHLGNMQPPMLKQLSGQLAVYNNRNKDGE